MSVTAAKVLASMLAFPQYSGDLGDTVEQRTALFLPVAETIARVAGNDERKAALLVAYTFEDTGGARYVYEGRCQDGPRGARCDDGRSAGPFQTSIRYCPTTDLDEQAKCALKAAYGGVARCRDHAQSPVHAMFIGLAGSRVSCSWKPADDRAKTYRRVLSALRRAE